MNIKIDKIIDRNDINNERVVLKTLVDADIGRYGIFRTGTNTNGITNRVHDTYWFPDKLVKSGDLVILYTKSGVSSELKNDDGSTSYFFYMGKTSPVWSSDYGSVLVSIPEWQVFNP